MQLDWFAPNKKTLTAKPSKKAEHISLNKQLQVEVVRRSYQRRWNLMVQPSGKVKVTCGKKVGTKTLKAWLEHMQPWIEKALKASESLREKYPPKKYIAGESFLYRGVDYKLVFIPQRRAQVFEAEQEFCLPLIESSPVDVKHEHLIRLYKKQAKLLIPERVNYWANAMGLYPTKLSLRGQKTRWGSCSSKGEISLNWKLIAAPPEILDYVVIHELAHLKHHNHSKAFWSLVEAYCPEYQGLKKWLRENHYGFEFLVK